MIEWEENRGRAQRLGSFGKAILRIMSTVIDDDVII